MLQFVVFYFAIVRPCYSVLRMLDDILHSITAVSETVLKSEGKIE